MAGIMNNTARQYNLKCMTKEGHRAVVRLCPGFNIVDDDIWAAFVPKDGKNVDPYVKGLIDEGVIGSKKLKGAPENKAKAKSEPMVKLIAKMKEAEDGQAIAEAETSKAQAEAAEARAKAEKAELELAEFKAKIAKGNEETKTEGKTAEKVEDKTAEKAEGKTTDKEVKKS